MDIIVQILQRLSEIDCHAIEHLKDAYQKSNDTIDRVILKAQASGYINCLYAHYIVNKEEHDLLYGYVKGEYDNAEIQ